MYLKLLTACLAFCLLGACSSYNVSTRMTLEPNGSMSASGPSGRATVENDGPGSVDVIAEDDDGDVRLEMHLKAKKDCRFDIDDDEKVKVHNNSDQPAFVRVRIKSD